MGTPAGFGREHQGMTAAELKREIGIAGAVLLGLGSIMGTGVYVALGLAALEAGSLFPLAIVGAALLALCNGLSSAQLAASHPVAGGSYEYGYRLIGPRTGFLAGWLFLCAKSASAATAALGVAAYLDAVVGLPESARVAIALVVLALVTTAVLGGLRRSNRLNAVLVLTTVSVLLWLGLTGLLREGGGAVTGFSARGATGYLEAVALVFVAFTGYGRIATMGEEIRDPARNIPRAVLATILVTAALYLLVGHVAYARLGAPAFAEASERGRPLAELAAVIDLPGGSVVTTIAAITAMLGVLLNLVLGLSRVALAMGRRRDLPATFARLDASGLTPRPAVLLVAGIIAALILIGDLRFAWSFSALTVLGYYGIANLAALRQPPTERRFPRLVSVAGLIGCLGLLFFVDREVWYVAGPVVLLGLAWKLVLDRRRLA